MFIFHNIILNFIITFMKGEASYYGIDPIKEHLAYNTAMSIPFHPELMECACWEWKKGSVLKVTNLKNNKHVIVRVTDRGPAKRLNRLIDLTVSAFKRIADIADGLVEVDVELLLDKDNKRTEPPKNY